MCFTDPWVVYWYASLFLLSGVFESTQKNEDGHRKKGRRTTLNHDIMWQGCRIDLMVEPDYRLVSRDYKKKHDPHASHQPAHGK